MSHLAHDARKNDQGKTDVPYTNPKLAGYFAQSETDYSDHMSL